MIQKELVILVSLFFTCSLAANEVEEQRDGENSAEQARVALDRGYAGYSSTYEVDEEGQGRIRVLDVLPGGPAERAGIKKDDLITAVNAVPFRFENDLEMIRAFGLFKAGDLLELSVLRDGKMHSIELKMTRMPADRAQALARWIEESEVWFEQGGCDSCRERQKKQEAFQAFQRQVTETGIELTITRDVTSPEDIVVAADGNTVIPPELDLADFPPLRGLIGGLRSGDSITVRFSRGRDTNALMIEPVVLPPYLEAQLAKAKKW